jgi:hypothetical protein
VRTSIFVTLGLGQLSVAWALRARGRRRLRQRALELAVLLALGAQLAGVYVPALNDLLSTRPMPLPVLGIAAALAVVPGVAVALSRRTKRSGRRTQRVGVPAR